VSSPRPTDRRGLVVEGRAASLLRRWAGLALPEHRWPVLRATLEGLTPDKTVEGALERLEAGDRVAKRVVLAEITVPETYLFRHPVHFEVLAEHALATAAGRSGCYRVLSAGCATGEEAWSAAAVLDEVGRRTGLRWEVVGWDLDAGRIARARTGRYSAWSARNGLFGHDDAFESRGCGWDVHPRLRGRVSFECVNLKVGPASETACFDVVFLRNVAMYWVPECMTEMISRVANLVAPGGLLLMGASEPDTLDRKCWAVEWRGGVRVARRRVGEAATQASAVVASGELTRATIARDQSRRAAARARLARKPVVRKPATPVDPDPLGRVRELADRGRYLEALAILDALPPAPEAERYLWRGILCSSLSRPDEALSSLRKAVFLAPFDVACRHWLAVALTACGRHRAAAREHRNIRELSA
jgi:chemotaxis methyl-accepting protein methylase